MLQVFVDILEAIDHVEDLCTYLFTALERIAAPVEWSQVDVFKDAEALLVRDAASGQQMVLGGWLTQSSSVLSADFSSTRQCVLSSYSPPPTFCLPSPLPPLPPPSSPFPPSPPPSPSSTFPPPPPPSSPSASPSASPSSFPLSPLPSSLLPLLPLLSPPSFPLFPPPPSLLSLCLSLLFPPPSPPSVLHPWAHPVC